MKKVRHHSMTDTRIIIDNAPSNLERDIKLADNFMVGLCVVGIAIVSIIYLYV